MRFADSIRMKLAAGHRAVKLLILINIAAFLLSIFVNLLAYLWQADGSSLLGVFYLPANPGVLLMRPWTLLSHMFFHTGFWHILGNMLWLYFIGTILNDFLPDRRIYHVFLGGGLFGGLLYLISYNVFPVFNEHLALSRLLGASGGVLAIVTATATLVPHYTLRPFNLFNIEMRWIALISIVLDLMAIPQGNPGGHIAHLGGALFGFLYIRTIQGGIRLPRFSLPNLSGKPDERVLKERYQKKQKKNGNKPRQEEVDAILDKISQSGYDSLSSEEKDLLFRASE